MWANNEINEPHSTGATNGKTITGQGQGSNVLCKSIKLSQSQEIVLPSFDQCQWKFLGRSNCQPRKLPHVISKYASSGNVVPYSVLKTFQVLGK